MSDKNENKNTKNADSEGLDDANCYATYDNPNTMRREWWVKYSGKKKLVKSLCGIRLGDMQHALRNVQTDDKTCLPPFKEGLIQGDKKAIKF